MLVEMISDRKIQIEVYPEVDDADGFSGNERVYVR